MTEAQCGFENPNQLIVDGPTIGVLVRLGASPEYTRESALIDTGAASNAIDSTLAAELALPVVDRQVVAGIGGAIEVNVHAARVEIPDLDVVLSGTFNGVHLAAGGQPHRVLLGRTFLRHVRMTYDGRDGSVLLGWPD